MSSPNEKAFLVFGGGNDRAVIAFLRALSLCKQRAYIVARTVADRILQTRYKQDVQWIRPDHALSIEAFSESVKHVRAKAGRRQLVVLPSTEYLNTFLLQHRSAIEDMGCEVPLPDTSIYARLTSKRSGTDFFAAAGISPPAEVPRTTPLTPPLIAKPMVNVSTTGESLYPHLLMTSAEVEAFHRAHDPQDFFFQEYVQGESHYLLLYAPQAGGRAFTWSQRNLLQQPGGKSMLLAEPSDFHNSPPAERILDALQGVGFHGLGMVEVIRSDHRDVFIEMNPRIWGPIQFCTDQRHPLLQAFIGDSLHGDPLRYTHRQPSSRRRCYFWMGGLLATLCAGQQPTWHTRRQSMPTLILRNLTRDVYLRRDSWRCFFRELGEAVDNRRKRDRS